MRVHGHGTEAGGDGMAGCGCLYDCRDALVAVFAGVLITVPLLCALFHGLGLAVPAPGAWGYGAAGLGAAVLAGVIVAGLRRRALH